jgi:uncharacterized protein YbjT (DUF2867 family)
MQTVFVAGATGYIGRTLALHLLARGHAVRVLVRPGSESKVPPGCAIVVADPFDARSFAQAVTPATTFVQLVGVPHPSPSKARQFREIDLRSALASISAAQESGAVRHFVYVSVAQPAPVMRAYQAARAEAEQALRLSGLRHTILRPWYVLGPGHRWPYVLLPIYRLLELLPQTRDSARRLGLVTRLQMIDALIEAIEHPPATSRLVEVPEIQTRTSTPLAG